MRSKVLSSIVERLAANEPTEFMLPAILLLACALPVAAFSAVFGLLDAGALLKVVMLGAALLVVLAMLLNFLSERFKQADIEVTVQRLPAPSDKANDVTHSANESGFTGPWMSRYETVEDGLELEDYAPNLLDDMLRSRGQGRLSYYQGL